MNCIVHSLLLFIINAHRLSAKNGGKINSLIKIRIINNYHKNMMLDLTISCNIFKISRRIRYYICTFLNNQRFICELILFEFNLSY